MTVGAGISVSDGNLMIRGSSVLTNVKDNIVVTPATGGALIDGAFIGVTSDQMGSRRVFPVGKLEYVLTFPFPSLLLSSSTLFLLFRLCFFCSVVDSGRKKEGMSLFFLCCVMLFLI